MPHNNKINAFTKNVIEKLACPKDKEQIYYRDSQTRCLYVQAARGGTKSFVYARVLTAASDKSF